ncbi:MAG TPA: efflux RND transporter periplasmic adaptor subunit [Pirellulales bacterium]
MRRRLGLLVIILGLLALVGGYIWRDMSTVSGPAQDVEGSKPVNTGRVVALGTFVPKGGVRAVGATAGDRVKELKVAAGQQVKQDEPLAYLESYPLRLAEKQSAELSLKEAIERRKIEADYGDNLVAEAMLGVEQLKLQQFDLEAQEAAVALSKKNLEVAAGDLERMQNLTRKDSSIISPQELNHQKLLADQARAKLTSDETMLAKSRVAQSFAVKQANERLAAAKVNRRRLLSAIDLDTLHSQIALAGDRVELSIVRAPISGQVLEIVTHPGETIAQDPVLRLGDTQQMYAVAEVYETQVSWIALNQRATVTSDALDGPLSGTVDFIATTVAKNQVLSLNPTDNTDLRVVKVHVRLDDSAAAARLVNLQVRVQIDTRPAAGKKE